MPYKRARFIKLRPKAKKDPPPRPIEPVSFNISARAESAIVESRIAPCVCVPKGDKWFCMKPDHSGRLIMVDGPFMTELECQDESNCG